MGKTEWARSLGTHIYFNNMWSLEGFCENVEYAIFDDLYEFKPFFYKSWFGAQKEFYATDKYKKKTLIKWGNPSILICNNLPDFGEERAWWDTNCIFINLIYKLY